MHVSNVLKFRHLCEFKMQIYVAFVVNIWRIGCLNLGKILLKFWNFVEDFARNIQSYAKDNGTIQKMCYLDKTVPFHCH